MARRPCKSCGAIFEPPGARVYRCRRCQPAHTRATDRKAYELRRARGRRTGTSPAIRKLRPLVFERDGWRCVRCGADVSPGSGTEAHAGHIVPAVEGGPDTLENLVTLCAQHNLQEGAR